MTIPAQMSNDDDSNGDLKYVITTNIDDNVVLNEDESSRLKISSINTDELTATAQASTSRFTITKTSNEQSNSCYTNSNTDNSIDGGNDLESAAVNEAAHKVATDFVKNIIDYAIKKIENENPEAKYKDKSEDANKLINQFLKRDEDMKAKKHTRIQTIIVDDSDEKDSNEKNKSFWKKCFFCC